MTDISDIGTSSTRSGHGTKTNPLAMGFYTVPEAVRLIEVGNSQRVHGWLRGYKRSEVGALINRQFLPLDEKKQELSFLDLIEVRFVEHFREAGVHVRTLRTTLEAARDYFGDEKPLATDKITFVTDGKNVFVEEILKPSAEKENDKKLWSLLTKQIQFYELIQQTILQGVEFDPNSHLARKWTPRQNFPDIIINPAVAYGKPIGPSHVPTDTIFESWEAEGGDENVVADWYDIPLAEVTTAVKFEQEIRKPKAKLVNGRH